jgi:sortase A
LLRWSVILLVVTGVVCLVLFFWYEFEARYFQASLSHSFDEQRLQSVAIPPEKGGASGAPSFDPIPSRHAQSVEALPEVVGRLDIPRIGVEVMVLKGVDPATLRRGAGWLPDTAQPGNGNAAIAAHRDTYFWPLRQIREGDVIRLTTLDACYNFQVEWAAVVAPDDTTVLRPTGKPALTLITCYPFSYVRKAPQRFVVRATRQEPLSSVAGELFDAKNPAVQPHDRCSARGA